MLVRNNQMIQLERDKMPVGQGENLNSFITRYIEVTEGDSLYLYTDGYADQFGGPRGKKFKYKQLNALLLANSTKSLNEQNSVLLSAFDSWRGQQEQVDDVCVIGVRLSH